MNLFNKLPRIRTVTTGPETLQPPTDHLPDDHAAWASVAGEEDPGAALDSPVPAPSQLPFSEHRMKPRVTVITLGVENLERAVAFYRDGLGWPTEGIVGQASENGAVAFFDLQDGLKLAVWPRASMAADAGILLRTGGPLEFTLGHNVIAKDEVDLLMQQASRAGATVVKAAQDTFYGGYAGYFMDPDGHLWEVVYNPDMLPES